MWPLELIIVLLLIIECYILHVWAKEHADLMSIISHSLKEIKRKIK